MHFAWNHRHKKRAKAVAQGRAFFWDPNAVSGEGYGAIKVIRTLLEAAGVATRAIGRAGHSFGNEPVETAVDPSFRVLGAGAGFFATSQPGKVSGVLGGVIENR